MDPLGVFTENVDEGLVAPCNRERGEIGGDTREPTRLPAPFLATWPELQQQWRGAEALPPLERKQPRHAAACGLPTETSGFLRIPPLTRPVRRDAVGTD